MDRPQLASCSCRSSSSSSSYGTAVILRRRMHNYSVAMVSAARYNISCRSWHAPGRQQHISRLLTRTSCSAPSSSSSSMDSRDVLQQAATVQYPSHNAHQPVISRGSAPVMLDFGSYSRFLEGILEMSRLQNLLPTMALVFVGGWIGGDRNVEALMMFGPVWIAAGCSALITVASMLVNDIFDFRSGNDYINGRNNPLVRGQCHPHHVELVAGCLYGASVIGLCYLKPTSLQLLVGGSAVATYIYTPLLKHLTLVKNVVVSGIISSTILVGALATGGKEQLQNPVVIAVALFFFLCILSREILMDVGDILGDKATGVNTLAVRFGGQIGTLTASFLLAAANALLIGLLAVKAQALATVGTLSLLPLHASMLSLCKEVGASKESCIVKSVKKVVEQSMVHIGLGVLVLASAA